jgi:hypothetical protein
MLLSPVRVSTLAEPCRAIAAALPPVTSQTGEDVPPADNADDDKKSKSPEVASHCIVLSKCNVKKQLAIQFNHLRAY